MISIIAAIDNNNGLSKGGLLPWSLPSDMKYFVNTTKNKTVIMGRKTWDSLPDKHKPLKNRTNVVISRSINLTLPEGVLHFTSLEEALAQLDQKDKELFVIGGGQIYSQALTYATRLHLTMINKDFDCDTFFPTFNQEDYTKCLVEEIEENELEAQVIIFNKK